MFHPAPVGLARARTRLAESEDNYETGVLVAHTAGVETSTPMTTNFARNAFHPATSITDPDGHTTTATCVAGATR